MRAQKHQRQFGVEEVFEQTLRRRLIASRDGREGPVRLHRDADLHATIRAPGETVVHTLAPGRAVWVQMVRGESVVHGETLRAGDGAAVSDAAGVGIEAVRDSEILLFDLD